MKKEFNYQLLWLRVLGAIPIACLILIIQETVIHKIVQSNLALGIDLGLILLALSFYYSVTEKQSWYLKSGTLSIQDGMIRLMKGSKELLIPADQVKELCLQKRSLLGSNFMLLEVKWDHMKCKLYSDPIDNQLEPCETKYYELYQWFQAHTHGLVVVKDIWGNDAGDWMKRN